MLYLILGGIASGKSSIAERICLKLQPMLHANLVYIATLDPSSGGDTRERILRHKANRACKGFSTIEWPYSVYDKAHPYTTALKGIAKAVCLLEDLDNLIANTLYPSASSSPSASIVAMDSHKVLDYLYFIQRCSSALVVVSGEMGEGLPFSRQSLSALLPFIRAQGFICQLIARKATAVVEVLAGVPIYIKGKYERKQLT